MIQYKQGIVHDESMNVRGMLLLCCVFWKKGKIMEKYLELEMEIVEFETEDIIVTSDTDTEDV